MKARDGNKPGFRHQRNGFVRMFGLVPTVFVLAVVVLLLWQPITAAPADGESVRAVKTAAVASQAIAMTAVGMPATLPPLAVRHLPAGVVDESRAVQRPKKDAAPDPPSRSNTCPATNVGVLTNGSTIVGSTIGSTDNFVAACGAEPGGQDEIFEFAVDVDCQWTLDSCTVPACWDTTLEIREDAGCPGDFVACDDDGCDASCFFESAVSAFLSTGTTYYLIVDGWSTLAYGDFVITATED
ncbi:MAG: hypothetical protein IIC51_11200, partial [Planctomycetes bacterium]|nr:hypothetical protein [Planctomycetota bacterium]